jgi:hypothetical protein
MPSGLARSEIDLHAWGARRELQGAADSVAVSLRDLIRGDPAAASKASWQLESSVVVQGSVFDAAEPVVDVLTAALSDDLPDPAMRAVIGLLLKIVSGSPDQSEIALGNFHLVTRCRARTRDALWVLVRHFLAGSEDAGKILELIDEDHFEAFVIAHVRRGRTA